MSNCLRGDCVGGLCNDTVHYSKSHSTIQLLFFPIIIFSQSLFCSICEQQRQHLQTRIQEYKRKASQLSCQISFQLVYVCVTEELAGSRTTVY